jgi:hypothetical protein
MQTEGLHHTSAYTSHLHELFVVTFGEKIQTIVLAGADEAYPVTIPSVLHV